MPKMRLVKFIAIKRNKVQLGRLESFKIWNKRKTPTVSIILLNRPIVYIYLGLSGAHSAGTVSLT